MQNSIFNIKKALPTSPPIYLEDSFGQLKFSQENRIEVPFLKKLFGKKSTSSPTLGLPILVQGEWGSGAHLMYQKLVNSVLSLNSPKFKVIISAFPEEFIKGVNLEGLDVITLNTTPIDCFFEPQQKFTPELQALLKIAFYFLELPLDDLNEVIADIDECHYYGETLNTSLVSNRILKAYPHLSEQEVLSLFAQKESTYSLWNITSMDLDRTLMLYRPSSICANTFGPDFTAITEYLYEILHIKRKRSVFFIDGNPPKQSLNIFRTARRQGVELIAFAYDKLADEIAANCGVQFMFRSSAKHLESIVDLKKLKIGEFLFLNAGSNSNYHEKPKVHSIVGAFTYNKSVS